MPLTLTESVLAPLEFTVYAPTFCDPCPLVPSKSWNCDTAPVPAVQVKVTVEPGRTLPGAGLVSAGCGLRAKEAAVRLRKNAGRSKFRATGKR